MSINKELQKAMIDNSIKGAKDLSIASGVSYHKIVRILKGDGTVRLKDVATVAEALGFKLQAIKLGEE